MKVIQTLRVIDSVTGQFRYEVRARVSSPNMTMSQLAQQLMVNPGVGQPMYAFHNDAVPPELNGRALETQWDQAMIVLPTIAQTVAAINAQLANPPPIGPANNGVNVVWLPPADELVPD